MVKSKRYEISDCSLMKESRALEVTSMLGKYQMKRGANRNMVKVGITDGRKRTRAEVSGKTNEWKDLIARSSFVGEVKLFVFRCQVQLTLTIYRAGKLSSFVRTKYDEKVDPCEGEPLGTSRFQ